MNPTSNPVAATTEVPREKLRELIVRNGDVILHDSDRCEGLLKDHCGGYRREISALVGALEERVPMELRSSWQNAMTPEAMRARLVQRLQDNRGLAPDVADWAVDAWSYALGVGLARSSDRLASQVLGANAAAVGGGWVGSQVLPQGLPPVPPAAVPAAAVAVQQRPASGNALKIGVGVAAAAVAAYFLIPRPQPVVLVKEEPKKQEAPAPVPVPKRVLAIGTQLSVRVAQAVDSNTAVQGQYINGTLTAPVTLGNQQVLSAGTKVLLQVNDVDQAGKLLGVPKIDLSVYQVNGASASSTAFVAKGPSRTVNTVKKGGIGGAIGCGVGTVVGVFSKSKKKGCAVGGAAGGATGVAVAAHDQIKPAVIGVGTVITFSLTRPLTVG